MDSTVEFNIEGKAVFLELGCTVLIHMTENLRELCRESDGALSRFQEYPLGQTWSFTFDIPTQALASKELLSLCVNHSLWNRIRDAALCDQLTLKIVEAENRIGDGLRGFFIEVTVNLVHQVLVEPPRGRGAKGRVLEWLRAERRVDESSLGGEADACCICLEGLRSENSLIEMPCSHLFHESCVLKWLEKQNACPLCRRPVAL